MKELIRNAMLSVAITGLACIGVVAQNTDQSSSPSATTRGSASNNHWKACTSCQGNGGQRKLAA